MEKPNKFTISEVYIQQRNKDGSNKGEPIFLMNSSVPGGGPSQIPKVSSISISENMFASSIKGYLTILDRDRLVENLKLSPLDTLVIKATEEGKKDTPKTLTFSIISISQDTEDVAASNVGPSNISKSISIEFTSNELYVLNYTEFDFATEDFIGPISGKDGLVQYISDNIIKNKSKPFSNSKSGIVADNTANWIWLKKNPTFYPWGKPDIPPRLFNLLKTVAEHAVDEKNPNAANFFFWQDLDKWNFRSIESILEEYQDESKIITYNYTLRQDDKNAIVALNATVDGDPETDFLDLVNSGAFASNYLFVEPKYEQDPYARYLDTAGSMEIKQLDYSYIEDGKKWKSIEKIPILTKEEYLENWNHNRLFDTTYGYFSPGFYNREKVVDWEYKGYTLTNRHEGILWQTPFDITDMDAEILRKIQKEIKEPLAKKRIEYANKMNLKEKWNVYRCSICCAGLMDDGMTGITTTPQLSNYEIVAAGSFTDVLNYDASKVIASSTDPFMRSGITISYDLNESPYNLKLGEFFNLQQNPQNFTKYRFQLEIARATKLKEILQKNRQARQARRDAYLQSITNYESQWEPKKVDCIAEQCDGVDCTCPTDDSFVVRTNQSGILEQHERLEQHEQSLESLGDIIQKLTQLQQEFEQLYGAFWSRNAFFFSKNIDYSFLKSGNNLFNVKSIKRLPIKGSKYEPFATRRTFPGYTFADGTTLQYPYSVDKNLCSQGDTANPYFDRKYSSKKKADLWESFDNPFSNYPYSDDFGKKPPKGPIWYRNWLVKYKYRKTVPACVTVSTVSSSSCDEECSIAACKCTCYGSLDVQCPGGNCSSLGVSGSDYVIGRCDENTEFVDSCQTCICVGNQFGCPQLRGALRPDCCQAEGGESYCDNVDEICLNFPPECEYCGGIDPPPYPATQQPAITSPVVSSNCYSDDFEAEFVQVPLEMYFESFSNDKNSSILNNPSIGYINNALSGNCPNTDPQCISITSVTAEGDGPQLYHPWGGELLEADFDNNDYNDYKSSACLFDDNLSNKTPPALQLEGLESYVRIEFRTPIGLETLSSFPEGFINTPGSEYFLPYIVLLTAGPFGAEAAKANISVIGQDPYGFDVAVKKNKNKDDFASMDLFDSGADPVYETQSCQSFHTSSTWLRKSQNSVFYRPPDCDYDVFTPMGIQDIFSASSLERSAPVKSWWDLWFSLPPVATVTYYNRHAAEKAGDVAFYKNGSVIGKPAVASLSNGWPFYMQPDTESFTTGVYHSTAAITPNNQLSGDELVLGNFEQTKVPGFISEPLLVDDPSNYVYKFADFPNVRDIDPNKNYAIISYPVGTMIYGGAGFTAGQVWKYDISRKTEYGLVQLSSDSMPSILALAGGKNANIEKVQKYYEWLNNKIVDWYQNTIFDNNFSAQFVVFSRQSKGCNEYKCMNPNGFVENSNCPPENPLCNCPCQDIRPDKITTVKDRFTGAMVPAATGSFGPEPSSLELRKLKDEISECTKIKEVLGEEWLGCVWDDPNSDYNCSCPCIGEKFYEYMKYNRTMATFWNTPLKTPLFRNAQMNLLTANKIMITVPGNFEVKSGQIINIVADVNSADKKSTRRFSGKWLVYAISHVFTNGVHVMRLKLCRDSNSKEGQ